MFSPPFLQINRVAVEGSRIVELGSAMDGRTVWRLPARTVVTLYRLGVRFFIRKDDALPEVYVDDRQLDGEPRLRTTLDRQTSSQLMLLDRFGEN
jgi:hypothetical protein